MLAPEDIVRGDYVAIMHVMREVPRIFWCDDDAMMDRSEMIPLWFMPEQAGIPLRVEVICLPFILLKSPCGQKGTLDMRRHQLARLHESYAKQSWKAFRCQAKRTAKGASGKRAKKK